jgi:hypothetical protein
VSQLSIIGILVCVIKTKHYTLGFCCIICSVLVSNTFSVSTYSILAHDDIACLVGRVYLFIYFLRGGFICLYCNTILGNWYSLCPEITQVSLDMDISTPKMCIDTTVYEES